MSFLVTDVSKHKPAKTPKTLIFPSPQPLYPPFFGGGGFGVNARFELLIFVREPLPVFPVFFPPFRCPISRSSCTRQHVQNVHERANKLRIGRERLGFRSRLPGQAGLLRQRGLHMNLQCTPLRL